MDEMGWAGRVMVVLRYAAQIVVVNLLWALGTVCGLVVLGAFPATRSAARLFEALRRRRPSENMLRDFWHGYRTDFWRTNLLGAPFWVLGALAALDLQVFRAAAQAGERFASVLLAPFVIVVVVCGVALGFLFAVLLRFRDDARATWRFVLVAPFLSVGTSLAIVLTVGCFFVLTWQWPVLVPLVGFAAPVVLATWLAGRRLDELFGDGDFLGDELLAPPPGPDEPAAEERPVPPAAQATPGPDD